MSTLVSPSPALESAAASTVACPAQGAAAPLQVLTLTGGVVTAVRGAILTTPRTCVTIMRPATATAPVMSLSGALSLGACDALALDGTGSVDLAGRPLTLSWTLIPLNAAASASPAVTSDIAAYTTLDSPGQLNIPQPALAPLAR